MKIKKILKKYQLKTGQLTDVNPFFVVHSADSSFINTFCLKKQIKKKLIKTLFYSLAKFSKKTDVTFVFFNTITVCDAVIKTNFLIKLVFIYYKVVFFQKKKYYVLYTFNTKSLFKRFHILYTKNKKLSSSNG